MPPEELATMIADAIEAGKPLETLAKWVEACKPS